VFCQILAGAAQASVEYSDEQVLALMNIRAVDTIAGDIQEAMASR